MGEELATERFRLTEAQQELTVNFEKYVKIVEEKGKTHKEAKLAEIKVAEITSRLQQRGKGGDSKPLTQEEFEALHLYKMGSDSWARSFIRSYKFLARGEVSRVFEMPEGEQPSEEPKPERKPNN